MRSLRDAADALGGGLFAVAVLGVLAVRRPGALPVYALGCAAAVCALAALHVRFATYAAAAGAAALPLALAGVARARVASTWRPVLRLALVLPVLLGPALVPGPAAAGPGAGAVCRISGAVALLRPHPGAVVLSDVNAVPELLYRTESRTVGSLFHRTPDGFMRLRAAWRSIPGDDPRPGAAVRDTGATLLLACPGAARTALVEGLPHTTLLDRVNGERPPTWLHRLGDAGPNGYVLYAVEP